MADDAKSLSALLNGLTRRIYYGEAELTNEFLKNEIYPDMADEAFNELVNKTLHLIKNMVSADMDMTQLEVFITAQMKKREGAMTEQQANVYRKFWKINKNKIHEKIIEQTMWDNTLQKISWRIDHKSQARRSDDINTSSAIVELQLGEQQDKNKTSEVVRFELDEDKLKEVLESMHEIEKRIEQYCNNS